MDARVRDADSVLRAYVYERQRRLCARGLPVGDDRVQSSPNGNQEDRYSDLILLCKDVTAEMIAVLELRYFGVREKVVKDDAGNPRLRAVTTWVIPLREDYATSEEYTEAISRDSGQSPYGLDDLEISKRLGMTRAKVTNLASEARSLVHERMLRRIGNE